MSQTGQVKLPDGQVLTFEGASALVGSYLSEQAAIVELYDGTNLGAHDTISAVDLLALSALNAYQGAGAKAMVSLWTSKRKAEIERIVSDIDTRSVLELTDAEVAGERQRVVKALNTLDEVPDWGGGGTRAAKLLHRLRPGLIPIWDKEVGEYYGGGGQPWNQFVTAVYASVRAPGNRDFLQAQVSGMPARIGPLRVWDILLWKGRNV